MNIRIIRLKNGEDVIAGVDNELHNDDALVLYYPMQFNIIDRQNTTKVVLSHYLPYQFVEHNVCVIQKSDILFIVQPKEEFMKYYSNSVEGLVQAEQQEPTEEVTENLYNSLMDMDLEHMTKH
jgi:hypothetical protein